MTEIYRPKTLRGQGEPASRSTPCAFVISVGNNGPDLDALCAGWDWTQAAFDRCTILLGDSLQRLTIEATEARRPADAAREAAARAGILAERLAKARPHAPIMRMSDVVRERTFASWLAHSERAYSAIPAFSDMIDVDARAFCERQQRHGRLLTPFEAALALSVRYLLEEVAIYAVLAEKGWLAETYLGSELEVLAGFMRGEFPGVAPVLERRTHISLRVSSLRRVA
jgi:tRNA-dependent cyclodipeptide synthase